MILNIEKDQLYLGGKPLVILSDKDERAKRRYDHSVYIDVFVFNELGAHDLRRSLGRSEFNVEIPDGVDVPKKRLYDPSEDVFFIQKKNDYGDTNVFLFIRDSILELEFVERVFHKDQYGLTDSYRYRDTNYSHTTIELMVNHCMSVDNHSFYKSISDDVRTKIDDSITNHWNDKLDDVGKIKNDKSLNELYYQRAINLEKALDESLVEVEQLIMELFKEHHDRLEQDRLDHKNVFISVERGLLYDKKHMKESLKSILFRHNISESTKK